MWKWETKGEGSSISGLLFPFHSVLCVQNLPQSHTKFPLQHEWVGIPPTTYGHNGKISKGIILYKYFVTQPAKNFGQLLGNVFLYQNLSYQKFNNGQKTFFTAVNGHIWEY